MKYKAEKYFFDIPSFPISSSIEKKLRITLYRKFPNYSPNTILRLFNWNWNECIINLHLRAKKKRKISKSPYRKVRKKERKKEKPEEFFLFVYVVEYMSFFSYLSFSLSFPSDLYSSKEHAFHHQSVHGLGWRRSSTNLWRVFNRVSLPIHHIHRWTVTNQWSWCTSIAICSAHVLNVLDLSFPRAPSYL